MISFYYVNWSMRFDRDRLDDNCHWDDKLTKFSVYKVFVCVMKNMIWWAQINVNSAQSQYLSNVLCANVLQSFCSLKTRRFVDDMQNRIDFNIHDVYYDWIVEIDVISQSEFETFREFCVLLTKSAKFDQFFQYSFFHFMILLRRAMIKKYYNKNIDDWEFDFY
jgi:hypothetical protein